MKALRIEIPGKPVLYAPIYDFASVMGWLALLFDDLDQVEFAVKTVDL